MTSRPLRFNQLPAELSSRNLLPLGKPGEPVICVLLQGVDNMFAFRVQGRTNRTLRFEWDRVRQCHAFRAPLNVWEADGLALAREALDQRLLHPLIVTVEPPETNLAVLRRPVKVMDPLAGAAAEGEYEAEPEVSGGDVTLEKLQELVGGMGKATRASALAEKLGVAPKVLADLAGTKGSGITITPRGWIRKTREEEEE